MDKGPKLKALLRHFGIRNIDVAKRVGVSGSAVSNWFRFSSIETENLARVAAILKTTTEEVLMLDVDEIIAKIESRRAARQHLPSIPGPTRDDFQRRAYTPEALNVAWGYDKLPSDNARAMLERYLADLEIGPGDATVPPAKSRKPATPRSTAKPRLSVVPKPKQRPKTRS